MKDDPFQSEILKVKCVISVALPLSKCFENKECTAVLRNIFVKTVILFKGFYDLIDNNSIYLIYLMWDC